MLKILTRKDVTQVPVECQMALMVMANAGANWNYERAGSKGNVYCFHQVEETVALWKAMKNS
jgi:hypothetical protein